MNQIEIPSNIQNESGPRIPPRINIIPSDILTPRCFLSCENTKQRVSRKLRQQAKIEQTLVSPISVNKIGQRRSGLLTARNISKPMFRPPYKDVSVQDIEIDNEEPIRPFRGSFVTTPMRLSIV